MSIILEARAIDTYYGKVQILQGLDLQVREGEMTTIIGPNGAGKSTALKALFGLVPVAAGEVRLHDVDVTNVKPRTMVQAGVCFVPQGRAVFPSLDVDENLRMGAFLEKNRSTVRTRAAEVYERFPRLEERRRLAAGTLSGGEQQMLAIGRALMADPDVILLDEPTVGLAPQVVQEIMRALTDLNREGKTLVIVEQNATLALSRCDQAYLLVRGQTRMHGDADKLLTDPEVKRIYLGGGAGDPDQMGT